LPSAGILEAIIFGGVEFCRQQRGIDADSRGKRSRDKRKHWIKSVFKLIEIERLEREFKASNAHQVSFVVSAMIRVAIDMINGNVSIDR
jgi:hypothetical protein